MSTTWQWYREEPAKARHLHAGPEARGHVGAQLFVERPVPTGAPRERAAPAAAGALAIALVVVAASTVWAQSAVAPAPTTW